MLCCCLVSSTLSCKNLDFNDVIEICVGINIIMCEDI